MDIVAQNWLKRYQRKNHGAEIALPDEVPAPVPVIPVHITESELRELRQGSTYRPGGEN